MRGLIMVIIYKKKISLVTESVIMYVSCLKINETFFFWRYEGYQSAECYHFCFPP